MSKLIVTLALSFIFVMPTHADSLSDPRLQHIREEFEKLSVPVRAAVTKLESEMKVSMGVGFRITALHLKTSTMEKDLTDWAFNHRAHVDKAGVEDLR